VKAQCNVSGVSAELAYKVTSGDTKLMPWSDVDPYAVAAGRPWRQFPWYVGQRNYSGMYWSATEATLVGYESLLELSRLILADFDRASKRIVSQPFQITARVDGERHLRVPDYLVLTDTAPLIIDVTRRERLKDPKYQHSALLVGRAADQARNDSGRTGSALGCDPQRIDRRRTREPGTALRASLRYRRCARRSGSQVGQRAPGIQFAVSVT
jgi:hypothetical protein